MTQPNDWRASVPVAEPDMNGCRHCRQDMPIMASSRRD